jgi:hypothetical protein
VWVLLYINRDEGVTEDLRCFASVSVEIRRLMTADNKCDKLNKKIFVALRLLANLFVCIFFLDQIRK